MTPAVGVPRRHIAVVIAAMDEAANIEPLYERLHRALRAIPQTSGEFIWVIEGTDGTADRLRRLGDAKDALPFTIIEPAKRRGLGAAFKLGFAAVPKAAGIVVTMDADLNHQPEDLRALLDAFEQADATSPSDRGRCREAQYAVWRRGGGG
jgi:dolichol-phosphate mannosyltransferase